jgi:hypothetical protein
MSCIFSLASSDETSVGAVSSRPFLLAGSNGVMALKTFLPVEGRDMVMYSVPMGKRYRANCMVASVVCSNIVFTYSFTTLHYCPLFFKNEAFACPSPLSPFDDVKSGKKRHICPCTVAPTFYVYIIALTLI